MLAPYRAERARVDARLPLPQHARQPKVCELGNEPAAVLWVGAEHDVERLSHGSHGEEKRGGKVVRLLENNGGGGGDVFYICQMLRRYKSWVWGQAHQKWEGGGVWLRF